MNEDEKRTTQGWSFFCAVRASRRGAVFCHFLCRKKVTKERLTRTFRAAGRGKGCFAPGRGAVLPAAAKLFLLASGGPISFSSERNGAAGGERMGRVGAVSAIILHISGKFLLVPLFSRLETFPASGAKFARKWRSLAYMSSMLTTSEFPFDFISAKFMEIVLT